MTNNDTTPCTIEDGSLPGQVFPCHWDATTSGNGLGNSFTLYEAGGEPTYDIAPTAVEVIPTPVETPATDFVAEVGTAMPDATPPVTHLASTGIDPTGLLLAAALLLAGIALKFTARRA